MSRLRLTPMLLLVVALLLGPPAQAQRAPEAATGRQLPGQAARAQSFMVVAAHPIASQIGRDVLAAGGNAVDAAVAVQLALNLVEPQSSGIGGGAFMLHFEAATGTLRSYDGRETAPAAATPDYWLQADGTPQAFWDAVNSGRSVGVPGTLRLLEVVHAAHGSVPWSDLIQPVIRLARDGFAVTPRLSLLIAASATQGLTRHPPTRALFFDGNGLPWLPGAILRNPDFAEVLEQIAAGGADALYAGPLGRDLVAVVQQDGGAMTPGDLAAYRVVERPPVCVRWRVWNVCGMGPPSSGGVAVAQILALVDLAQAAQTGATSAAPGPDGPGTAPAPGQPSLAAVHRLLEASKLAFADRNHYLADPAFVEIPVAGLLDPDYLASRARAIDPTRAAPAPVAPGTPPAAPAWGRDGTQEAPGTSHVSIVDAEGNVVSLTTTIESGFGSRLSTHGFLLNNELTDFDFEPTRDGRPVANRVEGGKRPRSSMAPTIVLRDGQPVLVLGSPGGSAIIGYVVAALLAILEEGLDPQRAVARGHILNRNGVTEIELGTDAATLQPALEQLGHEVMLREHTSGLHVIHITGDGLVGGADPRREGVALGD